MFRNHWQAVEPGKDAFTLHPLSLVQRCPIATSEVDLELINEVRPDCLIRWLSSGPREVDDPVPDEGSVSFERVDPEQSLHRLSKDRCLDRASNGSVFQRDDPRDAWQVGARSFEVAEHGGLAHESSPRLRRPAHLDDAVGYRVTR